MNATSMINENKEYKMDEKQQNKRILSMCKDPENERNIEYMYGAEQ